MSGHWVIGITGASGAVYAVRLCKYMLEHMLTLAQLGVRIIPAMPAFYNRPSSMEEMIDFMVGKVLDSMDIEHSLYRRWGEQL